LQGDRPRRGQGAQTGVEPDRGKVNSAGDFAAMNDQGVADTAQQPARPVGRITTQEMEAYLVDVLAKREDLRRLRAARTLTGETLQQEVAAILNEWQITESWSVKFVEKGVVQTASGRPNRCLWLDNGERTLWIEEEVARNPTQFLADVRNELVTHAVGGGQGASLPYLQMANGQIWNAQVILRSAVEWGNLKSAVRLFSGG
jgi:hypothetical protein